jgi:hypothetical protein
MGALIIFALVCKAVAYLVIDYITALFFVMSNVLIHEYYTA